MLNMNKKLEQREKEGKIIKCGIVGAGQMGRGMVTQMVLMKGITPAVVSDIDLELAVHAFKYAGVKDADIVRTNEVAEADKAMDEGKYVATTNSNLISQCRPVEVAIDATGVPDVGAKVATDAINNKKHVVMLNVETDVVIGPLLDKWQRTTALFIPEVQEMNLVLSWSCMILRRQWVWKLRLWEKERITVLIKTVIRIRFWKRLQEERCHQRCCAPLRMVQKQWWK